MNVIYNVSNPVGNRVISAEALCTKCDVPQFEAINVSETYAMAVPSFMVNGGDSFDVFQNYMQNHRYV